MSVFTFQEWLYILWGPLLKIRLSIQQLQNINQVQGYSAHEIAWLIEETDQLCMDFLLAFKDPFIGHVNYSSKSANVLLGLVKCMQLEFILKAHRSIF